MYPMHTCRACALLGAYPSAYQQSKGVLLQQVLHFLLQGTGQCPFAAAVLQGVDGLSKALEAHAVMIPVGEVPLVAIDPESALAGSAVHPHAAGTRQKA